ncbi:MAG: hypothetical protein U0X87_01490 [Anaerolineales bacterium]
MNAVRDALRMIGDIFHIRINAWRGKYETHEPNLKFESDLWDSGLQFIARLGQGRARRIGCAGWR